ncbi:hypothetical protein K501DRAFT_176797 [Backusella circina FSU 941]|nr:hypothetical protein K501DRAFT_176797 [Backusella circina FSU 941]
MTSAQWVYANGSSWIVLDNLAQNYIEGLWSRNSSNWIQSNSFRKPVYVDTAQMCLIIDGIAYTIARRKH